MSRGVVAEQNDTRRKTCFVAMPVSTPTSYANDLRDIDHFNHVLEYLFTPALEQVGYTVIPPKVFGSALIHAEIIKHLEQADLVLADLSNHNPNVFFELGIRTSLDRPVVLVKDSRTAKIPFDLGPINVLDYDESLARWTLDDEINQVAMHVSSVRTDNSSGNAMWQYFGLTRRGDPAHAGGLDEKVDLLLAEVTKLRLEPVPSDLNVATILGKDLIQTELIRLQWENVLSRLKINRRVAWILARNAELGSVEKGALTIRFRRHGDVKGFSGGGCDSDLASAIEEVAGFRPTIIVEGPLGNNEPLGKTANTVDPSDSPGVDA